VLATDGLEHGHSRNETDAKVVLVDDLESVETSAGGLGSLLPSGDSNSAPVLPSVDLS
jgi:hypothetical protein